MGKYVIDEATLTGIGNAIREKTGKTDLIAPVDMPTEIAGIEGEGNGQELLNAVIDGSATEVLSDAETVRSYAFYNVGALRKVSFPYARATGTYVFERCYNLTEISFPSLENVGSKTFSECTALTDVVFPVVSKINSYAFKGCTALSKLDAPCVKSIGGSIFSECAALVALILRYTQEICTVTISSLKSTPIASGQGYIYVPRALLNDDDETMDYRRATNWSVYAAQFRALEDYTVDGTVTGELDETKI